MKTISEEASEWFVAFCEQEVNAAGREAFDRWLRASPEHICAYLRITALWENAHLLKAEGSGNIKALVQRALSENNIVLMNDATPALTGQDQMAPLTTSYAPTETPASATHAPAGGTAARFRKIPSGLWRKVAVAASVLLVGTMTASVLWQQRERVSIHETQGAERRMVALADGSTLQLNARSRVDVRFNKKERRVDLIEGQALFSVARNAKRPFIVQANGTQVRVLGTQFDVYRKARETVVTVVEGQVAVLAPASEASRETAPSRVVSAGEQAKVTPQAPIVVKPADTAAATAWTHGRLVFNSTPLREVVAEFNRMSPRRFVIEDPQLLDLHISGTFPSSDPTRIVRFLEQRFGVKVQETDQEIRIQRRNTP